MLIDVILMVLWLNTAVVGLLVACGLIFFLWLLVEEAYYRLPRRVRQWIKGNLTC